jgi:hypothetical protein
MAEQRELSGTLSRNKKRESNAVRISSEAPALEVVGDKARRRLDRSSRKRFVDGGVVGEGSTPSLAEASELGWTVDNYPPRDLLKHGTIR